MFCISFPACLLQQPNPNYAKIIEYCDNVIELTPNNVKAYYRRGLGYCNLENYEKALESFDQAETEAGSKIGKDDCLFLYLKII
jgi:tetratricopeptide (TPR) repeat protein